MKKNRIIYLILLIISGILVYNYPNRYFSAVFFLLLLIPLFSLINIIYVILRFKLLHTIDSTRIVKGDDVIYTCGIYNEDVIPYPEMRIFFEGEHLLFHDQVISQKFVLSPRNHYDIKIDLSCKYRGLYNIGLRYVEIKDYFNIFKIRFKNFAHKKILVYPKIIYFKNLYINRIGNLESGLKDKRKILTNQSLSEIKEYEYGEKMNMVHWKLSARLQKLMSKKMESITDEKYTVFLDLYRSELGTEENIVLEDKLIELFVAFINIISSFNISFDLKYMLIDGFREEKYTFRSQFELLYEKVANMQFSKTMKLCRMIDATQIKLSETSLDQGKLFAFTADLSGELIECLERKVLQGYKVFIFFTSPKELLEDPEQQEIKENYLSVEAAHSGMKLYRLDISDDTASLLEGEVI